MRLLRLWILVKLKYTVKLALVCLRLVERVFCLMLGREKKLLKDEMSWEIGD